MTPAMNKSKKPPVGQKSQLEQILEDPELPFEDRVLTMSLMMLKESDQEIEKAMNALDRVRDAGKDSVKEELAAKKLLDGRNDMLTKLKKVVAQLDKPERRKTATWLKQAK